MKNYFLSDILIAQGVNTGGNFELQLRKRFDTDIFLNPILQPSTIENYLIETYQKEVYNYKTNSILGLVPNTNILLILIIDLSQVERSRYDSDIMMIFDITLMDINKMVNKSYSQTKTLGLISEYIILDITTPNLVDEVKRLNEINEISAIFMSGTSEQRDEIITSIFLFYLDITKYDLQTTIFWLGYSEGEICNKNTIFISLYNSHHFL